MNDYIERHRVEGKVHLDKIETETKGDFLDKAAGRARLDELIAELRELQYRLYAEDKQSLLVVLQAPDAAGKDGTIRKVFGPLNPQGVKTHPFKVPTRRERSHDFLWRIHRATPATGQIAVFNRSHYEDVLVVRVEKLVEKAVWARRYDHINHFESLLADRGTRIVKIFLHISPEEQLERFGKRLFNADKHWKLNEGDYAAREKWDEYASAYEDAMARCNTDAAPWYVIPADRKWYRDVAVAEIIAATLRDMKPAFPPVEADLDEIRRLYAEAGGQPIPID